MVKVTYLDILERHAARNDDTSSDEVVKVPPVEPKVGRVAEYEGEEEVDCGKDELDGDNDNHVQERVH